MSKVARLKNLNEYLLLLAGDVAEKLIRIKLGDVDDCYRRSNLKPPHPFTDLIQLSQEWDNRIANRAYEMIKNAGALTSFTSFRPNDYAWSRRKERMQYSGRVSEEWFNKYAKSIMVAPTFETSGVKIPDETRKSCMIWITTGRSRAISPSMMPSMLIYGFTWMSMMYGLLRKNTAVPGMEEVPRRTNSFIPKHSCRIFPKEYSRDTLSSMLRGISNRQ